MNVVAVEHTFETAHRLPHLKGKCENLHGHSWRVRIEVSGPMATNGVVVEFADLKEHLRWWVDLHLDHGVMLGARDDLASVLPFYGKVFIFGHDGPTDDLPWPTVESVATLLARVMQEKVGGEQRVERVAVRETHLNEAIWTC
jgi:6-pyruvoyltetrahydropterin/6-carboxytetrahydropterin synthase